MRRPFTRCFDQAPGTVETVQPMLRRIVAPNPSPMTFTGTNTYLVGQSSIAVVDPGPDDDSHLRAILSAAQTGQIEKILVTHSHIDHTELVPRLKSITGARVCAHAGRPEFSGADADFGSRSPLGGGEGLDCGFHPDESLKDGDIIEFGSCLLEAIWTPGHLDDHVCFAWPGGRALFTGDHIMGWSTSVISPPHGDMADFMDSLRRLQERTEAVLYPGHGGEVADPQAMIRYQIAHRRERENQILSAIGSGAMSADDIARRIYIDVPPRLLPMAARSVFAHLVDLHRRGLAHPERRVRFEARFRAG